MPADQEIQKTILIPKEPGEPDWVRELAMLILDKVGKPQPTAPEEKSKDDQSKT
jgi:hypothetical protein